MTDKELGAVRSDVGKVPAGLNYFQGWSIFYDLQNQIKADLLKDTVIDDKFWMLLRFQGLKALVEGNNQQLLLVLYQMLSAIIKTYYKNHATGLEQAVSLVCEFGAKKYAVFNYRKGFVWSRIWASLNRHLDYLRGSPNTGKPQEHDTESGLQHAGHMAANILMLLEHIADNLGVNDLTPGEPKNE